MLQAVRPLIGGARDMPRKVPVDSCIQRVQEQFPGRWKDDEIRAELREITDDESILDCYYDEGLQAVYNLSSATGHGG